MNTIFDQILISLFPTPRREFKWLQLWPLLVFIIIFGLICFFLDAADVILFTRPKWFLLMFLMPWIWWLFVAGYSGIFGFRALAVLWIRLAIFGIFIMLLAEPRAVRKNDTLAVMYVLDISDSIGKKAIGYGLEYVATTAQKRPEKDKAGLIVFGRDAAAELPPKVAFPLEAINSKVNRDGTDIAKALSLAEAMLPSEENGRIVLISDGTATQGSLNEVLKELKARKIEVDVLPIEYDFNQEVWLEKLELPRFVKRGETYEATVILSSLTAGKGVLKLEENGEEVFSREVDFKSGKNRFSLPIYLRESGYFEYVARITLPPGKDGWKQNNVAVNSIYLRGKGKVLMVIDEVGEEKDWKIPAKALREAGFDLVVKDALDFPRDAMSLLPYDCVIFINVPADAFDAVQLRAVRSAVYNQGNGFVMVGGKNSFGPGGYNRTPVEEILPVRMDVTNKKVLPKGALVIVLHTCEFADGNTWAKKIAKAAIKVMGAKDEVGVLAYDWQNGGDKWIFPLTPAGEYDKLVKIINKCEPGDMPSFAKTMELGLQALKKSDAAAKHMIIISDGDPAPPPPALVNKYIANKISISTVLVDGFHQGSYQKLMQILASSTGGRFYYPKDPAALPSIFIKEAKTLKRSMIQNKTFVPRIDFNDGSYLKGISSLPELHGYVLTSAKEDIRRCRVILRGPDKEQMDPVLAVGQFGVGKSAAFTSDFSSNWAKDWVVWDKFQPFLKQLIHGISRTSKEGSLRMWTYNSGDNGVIIVEDFHPEQDFLEMAAEVTGPANKTMNVKLYQEGNRRYRGTFPLWGKGRYEIVAAAVGKKREEKVVGAFVIPYSAEYLRFRSSPLILNKIAEKTGGRLLTGNEEGQELFPLIRETRLNSQPVFDIFLMILAILIPLDVGMRRVQIDFAAIIAKLKGSKGSRESTATLGALLKRKEQVDNTLQDVKKELEKNLAPSRNLAKKKKEHTVSEKKLSQTKKDSKPAEHSKPEGEIPESTTGRLLALKRKKKISNK